MRTPCPSLQGLGEPWEGEGARRRQERGVGGEKGWPRRGRARGPPRGRERSAAEGKERRGAGENTVRAAADLFPRNQQAAPPELLINGRGSGRLGPRNQSRGHVSSRTLLPLDGRAGPPPPRSPAASRGKEPSADAASVPAPRVEEGGAGILPAPRSPPDDAPPPTPPAPFTRPSAPASALGGGTACDLRPPLGSAPRHPALTHTNLLPGGAGRGRSLKPQPKGQAGGELEKGTQGNWREDPQHPREWAGAKPQPSTPVSPPAPGP